MPTEIVEQLEAQVVAMQFSLCSKQKQMQDYFKSSPRAPTPTKEPRAPTPIKDVSFKTVADVTRDVSLVDSLDIDDLELESIDTCQFSVQKIVLDLESEAMRGLGSIPTMGNILSLEYFCFHVVKTKMSPFAFLCVCEKPFWN